MSASEQELLRKRREERMKLLEQQQLRKQSVPTPAVGTAQKPSPATVPASPGPESKPVPKAPTSAPTSKLIPVKATAPTQKAPVPKAPVAQPPAPAPVGKPVPRTTVKEQPLEIKFAESFFGFRNMINFDQANLQPNVNYNVDTLKKSLPAAQADRLTRIIVGKMIEANLVPFKLIEVGAGIGTTTLSFLSAPQIESVISYEKNPAERQMLKNNIAAYHLQDRSVVPDTPFTNVPVHLHGSALYISDLPRKSLPALVQENFQAASIFLRTDEKAVPVPGWTVSTASLTPDEEGKPLLVYRNDSIVGTKQAEVHDEMEEVDPKWREDLKSFLRNMLSKFLEPDEVERYLSDDVFDVWIKTFTHLSYDPNYNYEELEKLGDKVIDLTFQVFLMRKFGDITPAASSAFKDRYASKEFQSRLSMKFGFARLIRTRDMTTNIHILEDVLEAFIGAVFTVSDLVDGDGAGYINALKAISYIYSTVDFDMEMMFGRGKTQLKEWFEGLHWGTTAQTAQPILEIQQTDYGYLAQVYMTPEGMNYLAQRGIRIPELLGEETARTEKMAAAGAFENALITLRNYGVTRQWVYSEKEKKEFGHPSYTPYLGAARDRLRKEGYLTMKFMLPKSGAGQTSCVVQLIGFLENGRKKVLESINACDQNAGKLAVLKRYATGS